MTTLMRRLLDEEEGATIVEYGLMLVLIALAVLTAGRAMSTAVNTRFTNMTTTLGGGS